MARTRVLIVASELGYSPTQISELEVTIAATPCNLVLSATPMDLSRIVKIAHPLKRVRYELQEIGEPTLADALRPLLASA